jgi:hypothetical protein
LPVGVGQPPDGHTERLLRSMAAQQAQPHSLARLRIDRGSAGLPGRGRESVTGR